MHVTETKIDELTREFKIALPVSDVDRKFETRLNELARTARLDGFRPGKVPLSVLRKKFGLALRSEVIEQAISESSTAVMQERGLRPAASPRLELAAEPAEDTIEYTMAVEVLPEIPPLNAAAISLERLVADVDDADVEKSIARLANATRPTVPVTEPRPAKQGDIVIIDPTSSDQTDAAETAGGPQHLSVEIGAEGPLQALGEQLAGATPGERRQVTLPGADSEHEVRIVELHETSAAPIDDEWAKRLGLESLDALKDLVRKRHEQELKSLSRQRLKRALLDHLANSFSFNLPKSLVEQEYENIVHQLAHEHPEDQHADQHDHEEHDHEEHGHDEHGHDEHGHAEHAHAEHDHAAELAALTDEQKREYRSLAERRVRLGLLLAEVGRANDLNVTPEEMNKALMAEARRYSGQEQAVLDFFRKNAKAREAIAAPILEDKVVDFILEMATVAERKVSAQDLAMGEDATETSQGPATS